MTRCSLVRPLQTITLGCIFYFYWIYDHKEIISRVNEKYNLNSIDFKNINNRQIAEGRTDISSNLYPWDHKLYDQPFMKARREFNNTECFRDDPDKYDNFWQKIQQNNKFSNVTTRGYIMPISGGGINNQLTSFYESIQLANYLDKKIVPPFFYFHEKVNVSLTDGLLNPKSEYFNNKTYNFIPPELVLNIEDPESSIYNYVNVADVSEFYRECFEDDRDKLLEVLGQNRPEKTSQ